MFSLRNVQTFFAKAIIPVIPICHEVYRANHKKGTVFHNIGL